MDKGLYSEGKLDDRYNWLSKDKKSRNKLGLIGIILFVLFYFSLIPIIPDAIINALNITGKNAHIIWSLIWLLSISIFAYSLYHVMKKLKDSEITVTDYAFYSLRNIHCNLKGIPENKMKLASKYDKILKKQVDLLDSIVDDYETIPSLSDKSQIQMIKTLVSSLRDKAIPALSEGKNLTEISEICRLLSMIFLDQDVNKNRNDCQVILDKLPAPRRLEMDIHQILKSDNPIIQLVRCMAVSTVIFGLPLMAILLYIEVSQDILVGGVVTAIFLPGTSLFLSKARG